MARHRLQHDIDHSIFADLVDQMIHRLMANLTPEIREELLLERIGQITCTDHCVSYHSQ
jgi:hypothetical protein